MNNNASSGKARSSALSAPLHCSSKRFFSQTVTVFVGVLACAHLASAELIIGLTTANQLTSFDSATPGSAGPTIAITGLVGGDTLVGLDRRPQFGPMNGLLYAFGVQGASGRIYTLNEITGVASLVSTLNVPVSIGPNPTDFGIDFNPTVDRLRIVSDLDQNLRANVDTGVTLVDTPLAYATGDPNFGNDPNVVAVAYSNNFGGATTTTLRDLDSRADILATQVPPNNGTLNTQFPLGVNFGGLAGYDISGLTGIPYASLIVEGATTSGFYTIGGGGATLVGSVIGPQGVPLTLRDIAAPVGTPVPEALSPFFGALILAGTVLAGSFCRRRYAAA